jgi:hypothetical protein
VHMGEGMGREDDIDRCECEELVLHTVLSHILLGTTNTHYLIPHTSPAKPTVSAPDPVPPTIPLTTP